MDTSLAGSLFRQLFSRCTCQHRTFTSIPSGLSRVRSYSQNSTGLYSKKQKDEEKSFAWQQKTEFLPPDKLQEFRKYDVITADDQRSKRRRPRRARMLMRDFIEDSLYNPEYGYFSDRANILDAGAAFDFTQMKSEDEFMSILGKRYKDFEDERDRHHQDDTRQLWHTPTELFRPHYAEAIARYMVANYKISSYPYHDLIIYELGAGNGTFMLNVMDYIRAVDPDVYARTKYKIIEISPSMAALQAAGLHGSKNNSHGHADKVEILNRSIFNWDSYVPSPCFVVALEVIDNFAHDVLRYDFETGRPMQGTVLIDTDGDFYDFYSHELDPVVSRYLQVRDVACPGGYPYPLRTPNMLRKLRSFVPFAPNLSRSEWLPTRLMQFFDVLQNFFPGHKLVLGDFNHLPDTIEGMNAPVVQTRYKRQVVPVTTPLVHQGFFDIFFPTDFHVMENIYRAITGKFTRLSTHEDFMGQWAFLEETKTRNGDNPLLSWYQNASFMLTI